MFYQLRQLQTLLQSYQNVSNSQRPIIRYIPALSCKRFCKVIKMLAIHNRSFEMNFIFLLQTLLQSYQNVSNSQLLLSVTIGVCCCKRFCKVIKMLAIHNTGVFNCPNVTVANAFAKLSKCQQFTTHARLVLQKYQLQTLLQSYQNVSNSQHI